MNALTEESVLRWVQEKSEWLAKQVGSDDITLSVTGYTVDYMKNATPVLSAYIGTQTSERVEGATVEEMAAKLKDARVNALARAKSLRQQADELERLAKGTSA